MANAYIFSVNKDDISVDVGQLGTYTIRGAEKIWARTPITDRKVTKDWGDDRFDSVAVTGEEIVKDIVSRNTEDGFFLCEGKEPTTAELQKALADFKAVCVQEVRHSDSVWERTRNREIISERARRAARFIGAAPEWLDQSLTDDKKKCPRCAELIKAEASWCKHCQFDLAAKPALATAAR